VIVLINGSFGVGKSTVSRLLRSRLPRSREFDPERVGFVLRRLPRWLPLSTRRYDDYQDAVSWRRLTVLLARAAHHGCRVLLVPMTFSNRAYLDEVRSSLERRRVVVRHFCRTASEATIRARLRRRGLDFESPEGRWVLLRVRVCCEAHAAPDFAERISTEGRSATEVAGLLRRRITAV
jgi:hypothetical protein